MRAQLIPTKGGRPIEVKKDLTLIGRKNECDIRLPHKAVSKYHCVVVKTNGLLLLRDLGSTNGTRVNGQKVRRAALLPNDQLKIAGFLFRVFLGPDSDGPPSEDLTQPLEPHEITNGSSHSNGSASDDSVSSDFDFEKINLLLDSVHDDD